MSFLALGQVNVSQTWVCIKSPEELLKIQGAVPHLRVGLGWGPKTGISVNFPGDADAVGSGTMLCTPLA